MAARYVNPDNVAAQGQSFYTGLVPASYEASGGGGGGRSLVGSGGSGGAGAADRTGSDAGKAWNYSATTVNNQVLDNNKARENQDLDLQLKRLQVQKLESKLNPQPTGGPPPTIGGPPPTTGGAAPTTGGTSPAAPTLIGGPSSPTSYSAPTLIGVPQPPPPPSAVSKSSRSRGHGRSAPPRT